MSKINDPKIVTERLKKDIIKLLIDEVVIEGESVKIFATIPLPNKIHEREMDKTDIPGTFNAVGPVNETNMTRIWNKHKQTNTPLKRKVLVGMSGGVDSSVAVALLVKEGYQVAGGFIKNWSDTKDLWTGECEWRGERRDAMRVAAQLGIPLLTFDFEEQYRARVLERLFEGYENGITPNPDVLCNEEIKFGLFYEAARKAGFDFIATGHYARVARNKNKRAHLLRGIDASKDQSYFLYRIHPEALAHALFPIGEYKKTDVRKIAEELKLPTANKPDSQGICFIGKIDFKDFLRKRIESKPGTIVDSEGKIIGEHDGLDTYTIGQRQGMGVSAGGHAWYIAAKDEKKNELIVVPNREHPLLCKKELNVEDLHWLNPLPEDGVVDVVVRYHAKAIRANVQLNKTAHVLFQEPVWAPAPGQSAVFYNGDECLGGGTISEDSI